MIETDVLVVGSGPAGGAAAALLATYGVKPLVITKWNWTCRTPRAHITNQRAMEVFRDLGIEDEVNEKRTAQEYMGNNVFCTSIAGEELGPPSDVGHTSQAQGRLHAREPDHHLRHAAESARADPGRHRCLARRVPSMFNWEYQALTQDADGVTVEVKDYVAGRRIEIRAKYVIGADGGRVKVAAGYRLADGRARWVSPAR